MTPAAIPRSSVSASSSGSEAAALSAAGVGSTRKAATSSKCLTVAGRRSSRARTSSSRVRGTGSGSAGGGSSRARGGSGRSRARRRDFRLRRRAPCEASAGTTARRGAAERAGEELRARAGRHRCAAARVRGRARAEAVGPSSSSLAAKSNLMLASVSRLAANCRPLPRADRATAHRRLRRVLDAAPPGV